MLVMCEQIAPPRASWTRQSVLAIAALSTATPCARLHARNLMHEWGLHNQVDTIELVVSELVTNAVQASVDHDGHPRFTNEHGLAWTALVTNSDTTSSMVST